MTTNPTNPTPSEETHSSKYARCTSCQTQQNCPNKPTHPNTICPNYTTQITYKLSPTLPLRIQFTCTPTNASTEYLPFDTLEAKEQTQYSAAEQLQCRVGNIWTQTIHAETQQTELQKRYGEHATPKFEADLIELSQNPDIEQYLMDEIHKTVSWHDDHIIKIVFYTALSAYLSPLNLALKCESGSGKTYSTVQTAQFFPPEDVQMIASQSPKVISHENGILTDNQGNPIPNEPPQKPNKNQYPNDDETYHTTLNKYYQETNEYNERLKNSHCRVYLKNKIYIFLESINAETFKMIKSTLSHDYEETKHKYVDDKGKVHTTQLIHYPACIFNSLDNDTTKEFATRTLTISPTITTPKIEHAKEISNQKAAYPHKYPKTSPNKRLIQQYIRQIKKAIQHYQLNPLIPFPTIHQKFRSSEVRDMRDFNHFLELVPAVTLFRLFQRPILTLEDENYLICTVQDVLDARDLFDSVSLTTKTGTEQRIINFYYRYVRKQTNGITLNDLTDNYNHSNKKVNSRTIRRWVERLVEIEWVDAKEGKQTDSRAITYYPLQGIYDDTNQKKLNDSSDMVGSSSDRMELSLDLERFCQMDFDLWQKNILMTSPPQRCIQINLDGSCVELSEEQLQNIVRCVSHPCHQTEIRTDLAPKSESEAGSVDISEMSLDSDVMSLDSKPPEPLHSTLPDFDQIVTCTVLPDMKGNMRKFNAVCPRCQKLSDLIYHLQFFDQSEADVCFACGSQTLEYLQKQEEQNHTY